MSAGLTLQSIKRAMGGGVITGGQLLTAGPGHRPNDQSLSIRLSHQSPAGFLANSFAGDDWRECRDFVASKLGLGPEVWRHRQKTNHDNVMIGSADRPNLNHDNVMIEVTDNAARIARAVRIWNEAGPPQSTPVEAYLLGRGLSLDLLDNIQEVIRFHPRMPWRDKGSDVVVWVPGMVSAMRTITGNDLVAIHRTALTQDGRKIGRAMLGPARGTAIKLDSDDSVCSGLHVAEGIESAMAARAFGFIPCWSMGHAPGIAKLPVLGGVECLTVMGEIDPASDRAVSECAERWHQAGREVRIVSPTIGNDMNDALKGGVA